MVVKLCLWGSLLPFLSSADFFQNKLFFLIFHECHQCPNIFDPDQARCFIGPGLGLNCLQRNAYIHKILNMDLLCYINQSPTPWPSPQGQLENYNTVLNIQIYIPNLSKFTFITKHMYMALDLVIDQGLAKGNNS